MKTFASAVVIAACALAALTTSSPAHAGQAIAECAVVDVATFDNRIHIHCQKPVTACGMIAGTQCPDLGNVPAYVAVESSSPMASSVVQVGLAALSGNKRLTVYFDDDAGANPAGCNQDDCRRIIGVAIH